MRGEGLGQGWVVLGGGMGNALALLRTNGGVGGRERGGGWVGGLWP